MKPSAFRDRDYVLWLLLLQARDAILKARGQELHQYGISAMEAGALIITQSVGKEATPAKISRWIFREHHTVSGLLSRMEKKGLVKRTRDLKRKNSWRIRITEEGQNALHDALKRESLHKVLSIFSEDERRQLESYLRRIRDQSLKQTARVRTIPFP